MRAADAGPKAWTDLAEAMKHYHPNFDEFLKLCEQGNTIPVYRQLLSDALTPVTAYQRLAEPPGFAPAGNTFLLESVVGGERAARFSWVAVGPEATLTARGHEITICKAGQEDLTISSADPLGELSGMLTGYKAVRLPELPPFPPGVYTGIGNCEILSPSKLLILLAPCFSTSSIRTIACMGIKVRRTVSNSDFRRSSDGSTPTPPSRSSAR